MESVIMFTSLFIGVISSYKVFETVFYYFFGIKNNQIWKWICALSSSVLFYNYPTIWSVVILLFGIILFTMTKLMLLTQSIKNK